MNCNRVERFAFAERSRRTPVRNCLVRFNIIDNATFHKGQSIREIVAEAGCPKGYLS